ncbi:hypothetical protein KAM338_36980 [Aeromonas caviae]|nr:hypothetical protein KAM338_36980 [Aeromonas caviae]
MPESGSHLLEPERPYQFCSIEPIEQFAYLAHTYLLGLGITDEPNPQMRK